MSITTTDVILPSFTMNLRRLPNETMVDVHSFLCLVPFFVKKLLDIVKQFRAELNRHDRRNQLLPEGVNQAYLRVRNKTTDMLLPNQFRFVMRVEDADLMNDENIVLLLLDECTSFVKQHERNRTTWIRLYKVTMQMLLTLQKLHEGHHERVCVRNAAMHGFGREARDIQERNFNESMLRTPRAGNRASLNTPPRMPRVVHIKQEGTDSPIAPARLFHDATNGVGGDEGNETRTDDNDDDVVVAI